MLRLLRPAAAALLGLSILVGPASALSWSGDPFTGRVGAIAGPGRPEAICRYNAGGTLKSITIKAPIVNGSHDELTTVGWYYEIRRAVEFHRGELIYRSRTWQTQASTSVASAFGKKNYYILRDQPGTTVYFLRIIILWYEPGSAATVEGRAAGLLYDAYQLKGPTESRDGGPYGCPFDYS